MSRDCYTPTKEHSVLTESPSFCWYSTQPGSPGAGGLLIGPEPLLLSFHRASQPILFQLAEFKINADTKPKDRHEYHDKKEC